MSFSLSSSRGASLLGKSFIANDSIPAKVVHEQHNSAPTTALHSHWGLRLVANNTSKAHKAVPDDFGFVDEDKPGTPITNKDSVLFEIDEALGVTKPPDLEYFVVRPFATVKIPFTNKGFCINTFGHSCIRYTLPNGEQVFMNIEGKRELQPMIQFRKPKEFLFGTDPELTGQQRALYNRSMISMRIENVPKEKILAMHNYFMSLKNYPEEHRFYIVPLWVRDVARWFLGNRVAEYGNCSKWVSEGLRHAGVASSNSYWPFAVLVDLFENQDPQQPDNYHLVVYDRVKHAKMAYGTSAEPLQQVAPFQTFRTMAYVHLDQAASIKVHVPKDTMTAKVEILEPHYGPSKVRNLLNSNVAIGSSVLLGVFLVGSTIGLLRSGRGAQQRLRIIELIRKRRALARERRNKK